MRDLEVYIIQSSDGTLKIGHSQHPEGRLKTLQTGNSNTLQLAWSMRHKKAHVVESKAQRELSETKVNGEWFRIDLLEAVRTIEHVMNSLEPEMEDDVTNAVAARSLRYWMQKNHNEIMRRFDRPSWKALARELERAGVRDERGNPPTRAAVRMAFRRAREKLDRKQGM